VSLNETYNALKDQVNFFCVYIKEAHPVEWWQVPQNLQDDVVFHQPSSIDERADVAQACMLRLDLTMPTLLDDMENSTDAAYATMPERLYVVDTLGKVAYQGAPGPWGFDVQEWRRAIEESIATV
jgi:hypothetical protein